MSLGKRIAKARAQAGLSQEYLAGAVGRSVHAIRKWERGENEPSLGKLEQIAKITGSSIAYLVGIENGKHLTEAERGIAILQEVRNSLEELQRLQIPIGAQPNSRPVHPGVEALANDTHIRRMYEVQEEELYIMRSSVLNRPDGTFVTIDTIQQAIILLETLRRIEGKMDR